MAYPQTDESRRQANREKFCVAGTSMAAAVLLIGMKLGVGLWSNSLGLLADAGHSMLDLAASGFTLWAIRASSKPADREHTYGHGKYENLSAFFQTMLLLAACAWIVYEACARLFFRAEAHVDANVWAFLVVLISIAVDLSRSRALKRTAIKHSSQALEADALHFSTDVWSSCVVLLGLAALKIGEWFDLPWLAHADAVAALGVAAIIVSVSLKLGKKSVGDLLDGVPRGLHDQLASAVQTVPGVEELIRLRLRRGGPDYFADATISVGRGAAFEQAHDIADWVESALREVLPRADIVVHVEPIDRGGEDITDKIRLSAARRGLGAHGIRIYEQPDGRRVELHLEVSDSLLLEEAHDLATDFERELRETLPGVNSVVTHIEPAGDRAATVRCRPAGKLDPRKVIDDFLAEHPLPIKPHDVRVQQAGGELDVSFHCGLQPDMSITDAHELTVQLEEYLRARMPGLGRIIIHAEPE